MKRFFLFLFAAPLFAFHHPPKIQIALLLDTSNSMDGLISQAKSKLWACVNELAYARKNGLLPEVEVALFEYGKSSLSHKEGYIRCMSGFTRDLDLISEQLFGLGTNGGEEFCGWVLRSALDLQWSADTSVYKTIFIAGNEPFDQGPVPFRSICAKAINRGVTINTIFCGNQSEGIQSHWQEGALLAEGAYFCLDHNRELARITTPYDKKIVQLGRELNETYVGYGHLGRSNKMRQEVQDQNAASVSEETLVGRTLAKKSKLYVNTDWDLVDAVNEKKIDLDDEKSKEGLPGNLKTKSADELKAYVAELNAKRVEVQKELQELEKKRAKYVAEQRKKEEVESLDDLMMAAVKKQAAKKGYRFEKK